MITSTGSLGKNVMAAEWTMQISYEPFLVAVFVHQSAATFKNIKETKEFGVNVASDEQTSLVNIAGGYSRIELDKLRIKNSFQFLKPQYTKAPMIAGCIVNAECKLVTMKKLGDHIMIVGKVIYVKHDETKKPLIYHTGRYYKVGSIIEPFRQMVKIDREAFSWFSSESKDKFVLKCVGALIKSGNKILVSSHTTKGKSYNTIPYIIPKRGTNYTKFIQNHLTKLRLGVKLNQTPIMKRLILQNQKKIQRVNFVLFVGDLKSSIPSQCRWKLIKLDPVLRAIVS